MSAISGPTCTTVTETQGVIEKAPDYSKAYLYLSGELGEKGRLDEAMSAFRKGVELAGGGSSPWRTIEAWIDARAGRREKALRAVNELQKSAQKTFLDYYLLRSEERRVGKECRSEW